MKFKLLNYDGDVLLNSFLLEDNLLGSIGDFGLDNDFPSGNLIIEPLHFADEHMKRAIKIDVKK